MNVANFGGLSAALRYYEFELDSLDAIGSNSFGVASTDWPLFKIGGKRPLENIAAIKIIEAQIPFSWYSFNTSNNTFVVKEIGNGGTQNRTITLPVGNFTMSDFLVVLAAALNVGSPLWLYTATYDSTVQKITIWNNALADTGSFSIYMGYLNGMVLVPGTNNNTPAQLMGFNDGNNPTTGYLAGSLPALGNYGNYVTGPDASSITGPNYLYVNSLKIGNLTNLYLPQGASNLGGGNAGPQMAKVPVNSQPGAVNYWSDPAAFMFFDLENLPSLTEVDFYLTIGNTSGQDPLVLNGQPFSLKLAILTHQLNRNDLGGGLAHNDRVVKRLRPQ